MKQSSAKAGWPEEVDLDTHQVTDEEIEADTGPEWVWARVAPEDLTGVRTLDVRRSIRGPRRATPGPVFSGPTLADDAVVHQDCVPVPRDLYLRLAREKAFPSSKVGKRVTAKWLDVKVAFANYGKQPEPLVAKTKPAEPKDDGLDSLRLEIGLVRKGK